MKKKTIAEKLHIDAETIGTVHNVSSETLPEMQLPEHITSGIPSAKADYLHLFVTTAQQLVRHFPDMKKHLNTKGTLWVSWPKSGGLDTDVNLKEVIRIGYDFEMVESTCLSIDHVWSALKFTFPKPGKQYRNSFGKHPVKG